MSSASTLDDFLRKRDVMGHTEWSGAELVLLRDKLADVDDRPARSRRLRCLRVFPGQGRLGFSRSTDPIQLHRLPADRSLRSDPVGNKVHAFLQVSGALVALAGVLVAALT